MEHFSPVVGLDGILAQADYRDSLTIPSFPCIRDNAKALSAPLSNPIVGWLTACGHQNSCCIISAIGSCCKMRAAPSRHVNTNNTTLLRGWRPLERAANLIWHEMTPASIAPVKNTRSSVKSPAAAARLNRPHRHNTKKEGKISFPWLDPVVFSTCGISLPFPRLQDSRSDHPRKREALPPHTARDDRLTPTTHNKGSVWCVLLRQSACRSARRGAVDPSPTCARVAFRAGPSFRSECRAESSGQGGIFLKGDDARGWLLAAARPPLRVHSAHRGGPLPRQPASFHRMTKSRWVHIASTLTTANTEL